MFPRCLSFLRNLWRGLTARVVGNAVLIIALGPAIKTLERFKRRLSFE